MQVERWNPSMSFVLLTFYTKKISKYIFFQTSKSTPFIEYFEPYRRRRLWPLLVCLKLVRFEHEFSSFEQGMAKDDKCYKNWKKLKMSKLFLQLVEVHKITFELIFFEYFNTATKHFGLFVSYNTFLCAL